MRIILRGTLMRRVRRFHHLLASRVRLAAGTNVQQPFPVVTSHLLEFFAFRTVGFPDPFGAYLKHSGLVGLPVPAHAYGHLRAPPALAESISASIAARVRVRRNITTRWFNGRGMGGGFHDHVSVFMFTVYLMLFPHNAAGSVPTTRSNHSFILHALFASHVDYCKRPWSVPK